MALRENQLYQIGLIASVILMVALGLVAFFGMSSASQEAVVRKQKEAQLAESEQVKRAAEAAVDAMQVMIGTAPGDLDTMMGLITDQEIRREIEQVRAEWEKDMQLYSSTTEDPNSRSWRALVDNLMTSLSTKIRDLQVAQDTGRQAEQERDTKVREADARADNLANQVRDLNNKLDASLADNDAIKAKFQQELEAAKSSHATGVEQYTTEISQQKSQLASMEVEVRKLEQTLRAKIEQLEQFQRVKFPVADGRIVNIAPSQDRVYINLGFDDGLQRRVSFSVFGRNVQLEAGLEKAAIEVTRILGPHQAEARIIRSNEREPIVPNDSIVTASWDPGYEVPVAIAGAIDIDGDGVSDLERLKVLVRKNQGILAAVVDDDGNVQGEITPEVRYLILGGEPEGEKQREGLAEFSRRAKEYYVQPISVREFLHLNGYTPAAPIQDLNALPDNNDGFVPRRPPAGGSAFDRN